MQKATTFWVMGGLVALLSGCSQEAQQVADQKHGIDLQKDAQKQQIDQKAGELKTAADNQNKQNEINVDAEKKRLDAEKGGLDAAKKESDKSTELAKKEVDREVDADKKVVDANATAAKTAIENSTKSQ